MNFDLPPLDNSARAAFATVADGKLWLGEQTLTNPANMQRLLCEQIELLNRQVLPLRQRFDILEMLHPHVAFVQEEVSKRYAGKPLPLADAEAVAFDANMRLWQAATVGYLRCLEDAISGGASDRTLTTLTQCALATMLAEQLDRVRGFSQCGSAYWARLHQLMRFAEDRGIAEVPSVDEVRYEGQAVTPLAVYAEALLLHAVNATEFATRPQRVMRWARMWSARLRLLPEPPEELQIVPICVDLDAALPPSPFPHKQARRPRFLDTAALAGSIKSCLLALAQGQTPSDLRLGDDVSKNAAEVLLQRLFQCWCKGGMQRPPDRHAASGNVEVAVGVDAIWYQLAGMPFKQPRASDELLRRERDEIATFGHVTSRVETQSVDVSKFALEAEWQLINESRNGMRLLHPPGKSGQRIGIGHLLAVRKSAAEPFMLASVRWVVADAEGALHIGVQFMPGHATPISFRIAGVNAGKEAWRPAFVLRADPAPEQLVLPAVVFRVNRMLDIEGWPVKHFKLEKLIERSDQFERAMVT